MWKKAKRIVSCILALILLLSLMDGQQFSVRAESEVKATQTEQAPNKTEETETSSGKEEGSEANNKENGKQEEGTQKEETSTKATEKTTETKTEDGKVDKPDHSNKENENNGQENGGKNEEKTDHCTHSRIPALPFRALRLRRQKGLFGRYRGFLHCRPRRRGHRQKRRQHDSR